MNLEDEQSALNAENTSSTESASPRKPASFFQEQPAHRRARTLGGHQDDVDVPGRHHAGLVAVGDAEAVREIQRLACGQMGLEPRPLVLLAGVGEEVLDDGAAAQAPFDRRQGAAHR